MLSFFAFHIYIRSKRLKSCVNQMIFSGKDTILREICPISCLKQQGGKRDRECFFYREVIPRLVFGCNSLKLLKIKQQSQEKLFLSPTKKVRIIISHFESDFNTFFLFTENSWFWPSWSSYLVLNGPNFPESYKCRAGSYF